MIDFGVVVAFLGGLVLGTVFFLGLLWGIRRALSSPQASLWLLGSRVVRTFLVLAGVWVLCRGRPWLVLPCLAGFLVARWLVGRAN
jgi:F1F0 ATPase subunit 2